MKLTNTKTAEVPLQFSLFASKEAIKLNWTGGGLRGGVVLARQTELHPAPDRKEAPLPSDDRCGYDPAGCR